MIKSVSSLNFFKLLLLCLRDKMRTIANCIGRGKDIHTSESGWCQEKILYHQHEDPIFPVRNGI
jgi:hypothetical protein